MLLKSLSVVAFANLAYAASATTMELFIDNMDPNAQWAASVVGACGGSTTYAIVCTSAVLNAACSVGASAETITEAPTGYAATTPAIFSETSATVSESCSLDSSASSAACVQTINAGAFGQSNAVTTAFNLTGQFYYQYQVAITAGADKLGGGGDVCNAKSGAASTVAAYGMYGMGLAWAVSLGALFAL